MLVISFQSMPVFEYITNYKYISEELCENKDRPELECNGKCYLIKQTRAQSEDREEKEAVISERLNLEYFAFDNFSFEVSNIEELDYSLVFLYCETEYSVYSKLPTPPPKHIA